MYVIKQFYSTKYWKYENVLAISECKTVLEDLIKVNYDICFRKTDSTVIDEVKCTIEEISKVQKLQVLTNSKQKPTFVQVSPPPIENKYFALSSNYNYSYSPNIAINEFIFVDFPGEASSREFDDYIEFLVDDVGYDKIRLSNHINFDKLYSNGISFAYKDETKIYLPSENLFGLYGGDSQQQILFAVSKTIENLMAMLQKYKLDPNQYHVENIGLWVLSTQTEPPPFCRKNCWLFYWKKIEPWRLEDKLFCYTKNENNQLIDTILRVGHERPENSWKYMNYLTEIRKIWDLSEKIELDKFYEEGMMNA